MSLAPLFEDIRSKVEKEAKNLVGKNRLCMFEKEAKNRVGKKRLFSYTILSKY